MHLATEQPLPSLNIVKQVLVIVSSSTNRGKDI